MIRVKSGIFSLTPPAPEDDDGSYLRWHLLDHMPEQYQLPGIVLGQRWIADPDLQRIRLAGEGPLADVGGVVNYLVGDPVQQTLDDFMELGRRLAEQGRFPESRPLLGVRMLALERWYAAPRALISAEVVPFRPHRGVIVLVEEPTVDDPSAWLQWLHAQHVPELLAVPGVAGAWQYRSTSTWDLPARAGGPPVVTTVIYLDEDPVATTGVLAALIEERWASGAVRPLFAGPLRTMTDWRAWP